MTHSHIQTELRKHANPAKAQLLAGFFKTGTGQYGEGDIFLGITVPEQRKIARAYHELPRVELTKLLHSEIHEERLTALIILVIQYKNADAKDKKDICSFYLTQTHWINNWDLVDVTCSNIVGDFLVSQNNWKILTTLAHSNNLWEKRIAIISTLAFIYAGNSTPTITVATILLQDTHDLIQKAVGWMLREVGKRIDEKVLTHFLDTHYKTMPRTTLRYAIERLSPHQKAHYMAKK
ncbi:MAG: DNA alkylation repair protein [Patescibacteria group bacterium]